MKNLILTLFLASLACSSPVQVLRGRGPATPSIVPPPWASPTHTSSIPLGTDKNPLILALAPSAGTSPNIIAAGDAITKFLESHTGLHIVAVAPHSESELIDDLADGNAHIAVLMPFGYLLARKHHSIRAILGSVRDGHAFYGAQFIARNDNSFRSYYDAVHNVNTADAAEALRQFEGKKPCWSTRTSPSGYVVPLGLLTQVQVQTQAGAFLQGQPSVVRAVYSKNICDFGATYIDSRQSPVLEADYPDVMDKVEVIWRVPAVIPYDNISLAAELSPEMQRTIQRAFVDLMLTEQGKAAMQTAYDVDALQVVDDSMYDDFETRVDASNFNLPELVK